MRTIGRRLLALAAAAALFLGPAGVARVAAADVANDDPYTMLEDQTLTVPAPGVLANDVNDGGPPLCVKSVQDGGAFDISPNGAFSFTPPANASGQFTAVYDLGEVVLGTCQTLLGDSATVTVTVQNVNDAPVLAAGSSCDGPITVAEDSGAFSTSDCVNITGFGPGDPAQGLAGWVVAAEDPSLFGAGPSITLDDPWIFSFTPAPNAHGSTTISIRARDTGGTANGGVDLSNAVTFGVTISPANDAPEAAADTFTALRDRTLVINAPGVLSNDDDIDGDDLTAVKMSNPAHGSVTLAADGGFSYTPAAGYVGPDAFSYRATDGSANSAVRVVSINVTTVPPSPTPAVTPSPTPAATPTASPSAEPSPSESLPAESASPSTSLDPGPSAAPSVGASVEPGPSPTAEPEPVDEGGGVSMPVLLVLVLLAALLAFGAAFSIPRMLAARRGAGRDGAAWDGAAPDDPDDGYGPPPR